MKSPTDEQEKERHRIAFHESGHALAAWLLGSTLISVTIEPATWPEVRIPCSGHITHTWSRGSHHDGFAQREAMLLLARPMAQKQHDPHSDIHWCGNTDFEQAEDVAGIACRSKDSIEPFLQLAERETEALVSEYWHCVEALASALLIKPTLTGEDAIRVMESAEAIRHAAAVEYRRTAVTELPAEPRFDGPDRGVVISRLVIRRGGSAYYVDEDLRPILPGGNP